MPVSQHTDKAVGRSMDDHLQTDEDVRISNTPRRSPQITESIRSPARSVCPQMQQMDPIQSQLDPGLRTTDFFDDTSDEGSPIGGDPGDVATDVDLLERRASSAKRRPPPGFKVPRASQCESKGSAGLPTSDDYRRLTYEENDRMGETPSSTLSPTRSSAQIPLSDRRSPKTEHSLRAHAIAHEIVLHALKRDENALDTGIEWLALTPLQAGHRESLLPGSVQSNDDPRSPRDHNICSPRTNNKKVHVIPPTIDTATPRQSLPEHIVRTPYPSSPQDVRLRDFAQSPPPRSSSLRTLPSESVLTLSILRMNPNSKPRMASLTIPAFNDFSAVRSRSLGTKDQHFKAIEYDDRQLFEHLRRSYRNLVGPIRFLSARSLTRIIVSGSASQAAGVGCGWISLSPRLISSRGLSDTFGEEKILQHYQRPKLGESRYAFVHWAHRLAAAAPARTPYTDENTSDAVERGLDRQTEQTEGLVFIVSWSPARIIIAFAVVLGTCVAAILLWTFLAHSTPHGGYDKAGDNVTSGVVLGICILLIGLSAIAGWLGVSWLVM